MLIQKVENSGNWITENNLSETARGDEIGTQAKAKNLKKRKQKN